MCSHNVPEFTFFFFFFFFSRVQRQLCVQLHRPGDVFGMQLWLARQQLQRSLVHWHFQTACLTFLSSTAINLCQSNNGGCGLDPCVYKGPGVRSCTPVSEIVGGAAGGALFFFILLILICLCIARRRSRKPPKEPTPRSSASAMPRPGSVTYDEKGNNRSSVRRGSQPAIYEDANEEQVGKGLKRKSSSKGSLDPLYDSPNSFSPFEFKMAGFTEEPDENYMTVSAETAMQDQLEEEYLMVKEGNETGGEEMYLDGVEAENAAANLDVNRYLHGSSKKKPKPEVGEEMYLDGADFESEPNFNFEGNAQGEEEQPPPLPSKTTAFVPKNIHIRSICVEK